MKTVSQCKNVVLVAIAAALFLISAPVASTAQESADELRATVRAAILADPRTATMSEEAIEVMVAALTEEAAAQGVTAYDIAWRPQDLEAASEAAAAADCGAMPLFFCTLNQAFGFDGSDIAVPIGLGITSALLLFLIGSILLHHHGHHPVVGSIRNQSAPKSSESEMTFGQ